jgi:hypothetical protein
VPRLHGQALCTRSNHNGSIGAEVNPADGAIPMCKPKQKPVNDLSVRFTDRR